MKETRAFDVTELRVEAENDAPVIRGHAAVFNKMSEELYGYREKIEPGAFAESIEKDDIRSLWNHNPDLVLGRNIAGTLSLQEDSRGLQIAITPPEWATAQVETIRRGDVSQMSFAFEKIDDLWETKNGVNIRTLKKAKVYEVSPCTFPAYRQTDVAVRTFLKSAGIEFSSLAPVLVRAQHQMPLLDGDEELIRAAVASLEAILPVRENGRAAFEARNRAIQIAEAIDTAA